MEFSEVFFYNQWQGFDIPEIAECFRMLSKEEVANLKAGDEFWLDDEPYHLNGKVYGRTRYKVAKEDHNLGSSLRAIFTLANPEKLESLVKLHGEKVLSIYSLQERNSQRQFSDRLNQD